MRPPTTELSPNDRPVKTCSQFAARLVRGCKALWLRAGNPSSLTTLRRSAVAVAPTVGLKLVIVLVFALLPSRVTIADDIDPVSTIFECNFQREQDINADRQPDGWSRRRDREHPAFIRCGTNMRDAQAYKRAKTLEAWMAKVDYAWRTGKWNPNYVPEVMPLGISKFIDRHFLNDCFEVRMDGGSFELTSPRIDLDARYAYRLEAEMDCQDLNSHTAFVQVKFYSRDGRLLATESTVPITGTQPWQFVQQSDISVDAQNVSARAEISLVVRPTSSNFGRGVVRFDSIRLSRMPTLSVKSNLLNNIAQPGKEIVMTCDVAGLVSQRAEIELSVSDIDNRIVFRERRPFSNNQADVVPAGRLTNSSNHQGEWRPLVTSHAKFEFKLNETGFYQVHASVGQSSRIVTVAVLQPEKYVATPFGVSLPSAPSSENVPKMLDQMEKLHIGWVKTPIWYDFRDQSRANSTLAFLKGLKGLGMRTIGRIDGPPESQYGNFEEDPRHSSSLQYLRDPSIWEPLLDPVLTALNSYLDFLQIGSDNDFSWMRSKAASESLEKVRNVLQYYFQDLRIAVCWDWLVPVTIASSGPAKPSSPDATNFSTAVALSAQELQAYVGSPENKPDKTWADLTLLPESQYSLQDRILDLLEKMIAVKQANLQASFVRNPQDVESGFFSQNMMPTRMLVPWIHLARAMGPRSSIGTAEMPGGSRNVTFVEPTPGNSSSNVMILWSSRPITEQFFWGDSVSAKDIWGRPVPIDSKTGAFGNVEQSLSLQRWPVMVQGVDSNLVRWRQEFVLLKDNLTSHLSSLSVLPIKLQNTFPKTAKGTLVLRSPSLLRDGQATLKLDLQAGRVEQMDLPFELRTDASAGVHQVDFQFMIQADKDYNFVVTRQITLGHPDIDLRWELVRISDQTVEARVDLNNKTTEPVSFDCTLFPKGQAYQRIPLLDFAPGTTSIRRRLMIPKSASEVEQTYWIRCEQIKAPLTLNYSVSEKVQEQGG